MTEPRTALELPDEFTAPEPKQLVSLRLDKRTLDYYRATGRYWQSRINADLAFMVRARQERSQAQPARVTSKRPRKAGAR